MASPISPCLLVPPCPTQTTRNWAFSCPSFTSRIDPTRTRDNEVLGGYSTSAMDEVDVERSSDGTLGNIAIEEAVLRELREDSATNGLEIEVTVRRGIARLRGVVDDVIDVENATEVASRVPGVIDVLDELEVQTPRF